MSSMLLSTYYRRMANVSLYPCVPNRRSMSSTGLDRHRQNCPFEWRIASIFRMYRCLDERRRRPSWNNLASLHLVRPIIHRVQIIRRNFATPNQSNRKKKNCFVIFSHFCTHSMREILAIVGNVRNMHHRIQKRTKKLLTNVSASKKTHFSNCVKRQQCNLVNVMPNSGRESNAKFAASFESNTFTCSTTLNTVCKRSRIDGVTPGVTSTANWWTVFTFFNEMATTNAPNAYESFVANVTHANSAKEINKDIY